MISFRKTQRALVRRSYTRVLLTMFVTRETGIDAFDKSFRQLQAGTST